MSGGGRGGGQGVGRVGGRRVRVDSRTTRSGWNTTAGGSRRSPSAARLLEEQLGGVPPEHVRGAGGPTSTAPPRPRRTRCRRSRRWPRRPGTRHAAQRQLLQHARAPAGRWRRRRPSGGAPPASRPAVARRRPAGDRQVRRVDTTTVSADRRRSAPRVHPARRSATCSIASGPPTKATRRWPCSTRWRPASSPPLDVVDGHASTRRPAGAPVENTTGTPRAVSCDSREPRQSSTGVISTPRTRCSSQQFEVVAFAPGVLAAVAHDQREPRSSAAVLGARGPRR